MASPNKKKRDKRSGINQPLSVCTPMKIGFKDHTFGSARYMTGEEKELVEKLRADVKEGE